MKSCDVLIVEDEPDWQEIIQNTLRADFSCCCVSDYRSAASVMPYLSPQVLVLDLNLGDASTEKNTWKGWYLADIASKLEVASVIVTGHVDDRISSRAFRDFGVIDLFDKATFVETKHDFVQRVHEAKALTIKKRIQPNIVGEIVVQTIEIFTIETKDYLRIKIESMDEVITPFVPPFSTYALHNILQIIASNRLPDHITPDEQKFFEEIELLTSSETPDELLRNIGIKLYDALAREKVGTALEMVRRPSQKANQKFSLRLHLNEHATHLAQYPCGMCQ